MEPEAYGGVPLDRHNAAVASAVDALLGERLRMAGLLAGPLAEATGLPGGEALWTSAVLAGALHDVGKASPHYAGRGSYYGHELVGAALLLEAALGVWRDSPGGALLLALAAWAVARHHAAMQGRHPLKAARGGGIVRAAASAVRALARAPGCLSLGLPPEVRGTRLEGLLLDALERLGANTGRLPSLAQSLATYQGVEALAEKAPGMGAQRWAALVSAASGAVIVADILVASSEGRDTDDRGGRAYVVAWLDELGPAAGRVVQRLASSPPASPALASMAARISRLL